MLGVRGEGCAKSPLSPMGWQKRSEKESDARDEGLRRWDELRTPHERLANCAEVVEERPRIGEEHADAPRRHLDAGGDFDEAHPPRAGVTFTKRVCFPAAVEVSTARTASACFNGNSIFLEIVTGTFLRRRIGDLLSQRYQ